MTVAPINTIPAHVTVREYDDHLRNPPPRRNSPGNLIEQAAQCDNRDIAASALLTALHIFDERVCRDSLSDPERWRRISPESRLMEIAEWLRAEAYESMGLVRLPHPIPTLGD